MRKITNQVYLSFISLSLFAVFPGSSCSAGTHSDPKIMIKSGDKSVTFKRSELLSRPDLTPVDVDSDPAYSGKKMHYVAVPVHALMKDFQVPDSATIQFHCMDGFSAVIAQEKILNSSTKGSIAFLAVEKKVTKWPAVNPQKSTQTAGPFYLIWKNPKLSNIGREEWPFQLVGIEISLPLEKQFPAILPDPKLPENSSVKRGLKVFAKNCFTCHTLNLQGKSQFGPDLNYPKNPTEYLKEQSLRTLIRDPKQLRAWPNGQMKGFSKDDLSDTELDDLIQYLTHMSQRKVTR